MGQILHAVKLVSSGERDRYVVKPPEGDDGKGFPHFFVVKPELLNLQKVDLDSVLSMLEDRFSDFGVTVGGVVVWNGNYSKKVNFVGENWYVLNSISRMGLEFLPSDDAKSFRETYPGMRVFGGHQLIELTSELTEYCLDVICRSTQTIKIAPGCYQNIISLEGENICLLNGFHPQQQLWFERPDNLLIGLEIYSEMPLRALRSDLMGTNFPEDCGENTLKHTLYSQRSQWGVDTVSIAKNGFHLSPNYLDAMQGLKAVFAEDVVNLNPDMNWMDSDTLRPIDHLVSKGLGVLDCIEDLDFIEANNALGQLFEIENV